MSDSIDNCTTIQTMIDAQYALFESEQALYTSLIAQRNALGTTQADLSSVTNAGEGGSESYSVATVTEQLNASAGRLRELREELLRLFELGNQRFPWVSTPRNRRRSYVLDQIQI